MLVRVSGFLAFPAILVSQDTTYFAAVGRVSVYEMATLPWQQLGADIRIKSVVGTIGTFTLAEFEGRAVAAAHHHAREQTNLGLSGTLLMTIDSQTVPLVLGSVAVVPSNVTHGIRNAGTARASMIEFHTVQRVDLVPPRPRQSFPRSEAPAALPTARRVFAAYDSAEHTSFTDDATIVGETSSVRIRQLKPYAELPIQADARPNGERLIFVLRGYGRLFAAAGEHSVSPGTLIVVPANVPPARLQANDKGDLVVADFAVFARH